MAKLTSVIVLVIVAALAGCAKRAIEVPPDVVAKPLWDPSDINVTAFLFANDFDSLIEEKSSILKKEDIPTIAHVGVVTTAGAYERDFDANEIAANQKYRGQKVLVYGTVGSINIDALGQGYFILISSNMLGVQAHLDRGAYERAAAERKGDRVALTCDPGPRIIGFATLENCLYLSQYMRREHVAPDEQVRGFFTGKTALPFREAVELMYIYAWTPLLSIECRTNPSATTCDISKQTRGKLSVKETEEQITQSMNRFKPYMKPSACSDSTQATVSRNGRAATDCLVLHSN